MSWTDKELDKLFSDSAKGMTFEYKKEYFKDIEKHLPISMKRDILWTGMTLLMGSIVVYLMIQPTESVWTDSAVSEKVLAVNEKMAESDLITDQNAFRTEEKSVDGIQQELKSNVLIKISDPEVEVIIPETPSLEVSTGESIAQSIGQNEMSNKKVEEIFTESSNDQSSLALLGLKPIDETSLSNELLAGSPQVDRIDVTPELDFFVQGLAGIGQGKMLPGEKSSMIAGLGIGAEFNRKRLSASIALNGVISYHQGMELTRMSKVYGFGSTEYKSTVEYSKLFVAESELTLGYRMGRLTAFGGVNINYLATTEATVSNFENEQLNTLAVRKLYGYKTGLKNWGLKPMVGMSYDFKNRLQFGATVGAHVIETVESEFLEGISRPLPLEGRVYLRLKL